MFKRAILTCLVIFGIVESRLIYEGKRLRHEHLTTSTHVAPSENRLRIAAIGESVTAGLYIADPNETYPQQLESLLRDYYQTDRYFVEDRLHPNRHGCRLIAETVLRRLVADPVFQEGVKRRLGLVRPALARVVR